MERGVEEASKRLGEDGGLMVGREEGEGRGKRGQQVKSLRCHPNARLSASALVASSALCVRSCNRC